VDAKSEGRYGKIKLSKLKKRIARDMGVSSHALDGRGRSQDVSRASAILCYVWTNYLRQSGRKLARELGVSPQAVYAASSRVEWDGGLVFLRRYGGNVSLASVLLPAASLVSCVTLVGVFWMIG
jgi:hypothetical protein